MASPDTRAEALAVYQQDGAAAAARHAGVSRATIYNWANAAGIDVKDPKRTAAATASRLADVAERKTQLASDLLDDAQALRAQLFAPCVERKAMSVSDGKDSGSHVEIIDIERDKPTFSEQVRVLTATAIAVDKVQLLTGEATERIESVSKSEIDRSIERLVEAHADA